MRPQAGDFKAILALSIPLVITGVMQAAIGFSQNMFLARLGPDVLAAGALVSSLYFTLCVVIYGVFSSINVLVSHKHGANDVLGISYVLRDGTLLAVLLVVPFSLLLWNMSPIFLLFGQSQTLVNLAALYLHPLALGLLPQFIIIVLIEALLGLGHTRTITVYTLATIPIFIIVSYVLIFGKLGFPALGIAGAGWGMAIGDWISAIILAGYVFSRIEYRPYFDAIFKFIKPSYLSELLQIGVPMGAMFGVEVSFFFVMALLIGSISIDALAANQVTMQYMGPLMGTIFYIAQAITVRMGHQLGALHVDLAVRAAYAGIILAGIYMSMVAIIYFVFPGVLISIDFNMQDPKNFETVRLTKQFLYVAAIFQIVESIRISLFGALRGFKDTKFTLLTSILSFWLIALPLGYLLSIHYKLGGVGFWWGMMSGCICGILLLHRRFKYKVLQTQHLMKKEISCS